MTNPRTRLASALATMLACASIAPAYAVGAAPAQRVQAYYGGYAWHLPDYQAPQHVDMRTMTHFVFARIGPGGGQGGGAPGDVVLGATDAQTRTDIGPGAPGKTVEDYMIGRAHQVGTKAMIMLGGAGDNDGFRVSTQPAVRARFVKRLVDYAVAHDYDGIDVDWEGIPQSATGDQDLLEALLRELRAEAATRPRYQSKPFLISFAADALNPNYQRVLPHHARVAALVDFFDVMTYGMAWFGDGWNTSTFAPINGRAGNRPLDVANSLAMYEAGGVPRAKMALGIGFYGMSYKPPYTRPDQPTSGDASAFSANDVLWNYTQLNKHGYLTRGTFVFDQVAQMGYRSYAQGYTPATRPSTTSGYISYEDERSIAAKGAWSRSTRSGEGAAGTIVWLINYGSTDGVNNPLMAAVKKGFLEPGTTPDPTPPSGMKLSISTTMGNDWTQGYCATINVRNIGQSAGEWVVAQPFKDRITALWNGKYVVANAVLTLRGEEWNKRIDPGQLRQVGFCATRSAAKLR
ncbi:glycoside hydrolase family 18 protein [Massilia sp. CF038]|uniref:glycoside hydrolase family 18 protein n=1 Tax=Massilia sp. CF038 TaxID=1881045 RepID=UPI00091210C3|nr:glycoside hydrolase family 18 protein [Massilia sp. CF038]SHG70778.1 chitinase [Massilia sp. CF038]